MALLEIANIRNGDNSLDAADRIERLGEQDSRIRFGEGRDAYAYI